MTKKAFKLLLSIQAKSTCWFVGIYALVLAILLVVFSYVTIDDTSWIPISIIYSPKIYLLVMGIVYPLLITKLFVSRGPDQKTVLLGIYRSHKHHIAVSAHTAFSFSNIL